MKRTFCILMSLAMILTLFAGCGKTEAPAETPAAPAAPAETVDSGATAQEPVVTLRLAHCNPEGDPTDLEAKKFAELVGEYSGGKVAVEIYPNAILGDWTELLEGLSTGICDIMIEGYGDLEGYSIMGALDAVPFVYNSYDHFMNVWYGEVGDAFQQKTLEDSGIRIFGAAYRGARIVTSTKSFTNADELADLGLKIRVPALNMYTRTWEYLETNTTPISLNEVLTCLQQGTVEAQENPCIMSYNYGFYDVCDYLVKTNHVYSATTFMIDDDLYSSYDADIQEAIFKAAEESGQWVSEYIRDIEGEYFAKWEEEGCTVIDPDRESFAAKLDGMVEAEFPELMDYVEMIKEAA